jgi:2-iminobutanoate/2-iminopropanoate deaminase
MTRQFISNANAPASPLFSQAVRVGNLIFVSGTAGIDPATQRVAGPTIGEQTRQAILNCRNILIATGATLADVVEVQALLARPDDFAGLNEAYAPFFTSDPPARSVARLGPELPGILVSIRMTAMVAD